MSKFVLINKDGSFESFYDDEINTKIPDGAVQLTTADRDTWAAAGPDGYRPGPARQDGTKTIVAYTPPPLPPPARTATVSALLDALSSTQRAAVTVDHMARLVARAALGPVLITDPKIGRAAVDMGLTPDVWFALAGA